MNNKLYIIIPVAAVISLLVVAISTFMVVESADFYQILYDGPVEWYGYVPAAILEILSIVLCTITVNSRFKGFLKFVAISGLFVLIIIAAAMGKILPLAQARGIPVETLGSRDELGAALGSGPLAALAVTRSGFAKQVRERLGRD